MWVPNELLAHLRRTRDLIDRCYAEPLDLDSLAAEANVSKYHFLRSFAAAYGHTPGAGSVTPQFPRSRADPGTGEGHDGRTGPACRRLSEDLRSKGVEFLQEPAERPYGVEAVCRDNSGNWLVLVERREFGSN